MEASLKRRSELSGIPLDAFDEGSLEAFVESCMDGKNHQIILLGLGDLVRARAQGEYRTMVQGADLVLPLSPSIPCAARRFGIEDLPVHDSFTFVIKLLSALESKGRSVFLAGGSKKLLAKAERNLLSTFPGLRLVGRHSGGYPKSANAPLMEAIRKATPTLILVGPGVPGAEAWIPATMPRINSGIFLWCPDIFTTLATGRRRRPQPSHREAGARSPSAPLAARLAGFIASVRLKSAVNT